MCFRVRLYLEHQSVLVLLPSLEAQDPEYINSNAGDNKVVICWTRGGDGRGIVGTIGGTSISFGSQATFESGTAVEKWIVYDEDIGTPVVYYRDGDNYGVEKIINIDGTTISFGNLFYINGNNGHGTMYLAYIILPAKNILCLVQLQELRLNANQYTLPAHETWLS